VLKLFDGFRCHLADTLHLWGPVTYRVRWGPWLSREGEIWGRIPGQNMQLLIAAEVSVLLCHLVNTNEESDSAFCQLTLVLVSYTMIMLLLSMFWRCWSLLMSRQSSTTPRFIYDLFIYSFILWLMQYIQYVMYFVYDFSSNNNISTYVTSLTLTVKNGKKQVRHVCTLRLLLRLSVSEVVKFTYSESKSDFGETSTRQNVHETHYLVNTSFQKHSFQSN